MQRPRVLAVDDEEQILISINDLLEEEFEVRTANSGAQALEILQKDRCAVIVTDQRMPEMTGDEFLHKAREISGASRILLTGYADLNALERARTDLNEVLSASLQLLRASLEEENATVTLPDKFPTALCNPNMIQEVFHNLILNSVNYNDKPEKRIEIGIAPPPTGAVRNQIAIRVRDNGIGIEPHCADRVFEMFQRLHGPGEFGGGYGVGLAWSKRIVELHGGKIWFESRPGQGADFYFTLELAPDPD